MTAVDVLELVLTANCNLRCRYCYQNDKKPRSVSWDTLRGALDLLLASGGSQGDVVFLGGEPLLEFPLIRRAVAYVGTERGTPRPIRYSLLTNGTLLGPEVSRFLALHAFDVKLSFDGVPEAQALRGRGTFARLDALLDRLRRDEPRLFGERLSVSLTITPATVPFLARSIAYFLEKGVGKIDVAPAITPEPGWGPGRVKDLEWQFARVFLDSVEHFQRTGRVPLGLFRRRSEQSPPLPEGAVCRAPGGRVLAVDVDGEVYGCAAFARSYQRLETALLEKCSGRVSLGSFSAEGFRARLSSYPRQARKARAFFDKRGQHSAYGRCADCLFVDSCVVCPASIARIPGNTDPRRAPAFVCAFNRTALGWSALFPASPPWPLARSQGLARGRISPLPPRSGP